MLTEEQNNLILTELYDFLEFFGYFKKANSTSQHKYAVFERPNVWKSKEDDERDRPEYIEVNEKTIEWCSELTDQDLK